MKNSEYYIKNVYLSEFHTKLFKIEAINDLIQTLAANGEDTEIAKRIKTEILGNESIDDLEKDREYYEREEDIESLSYAIAADTLSLGKPQPENLEQAMLHSDDVYYEIVKRATLKSHHYNQKTGDAEKTAKQILESEGFTFNNNSVNSKFS